jgi:hypothetical protein
MANQLEELLKEDFLDEIAYQQTEYNLSLEDAIDGALESCETNNRTIYGDVIKVLLKK